MFCDYHTPHGAESSKASLEEIIKVAHSTPLVSASGRRYLSKTPIPLAKSRLQLTTKRGRIAIERSLYSALYIVKRTE